MINTIDNVTCEKQKNPNSLNYKIMLDLQNGSMEVQHFTINFDDFPYNEKGFYDMYTMKEANSAMKEEYFEKMFLALENLGIENIRDEEIFFFENSPLPLENYIAG